MRHNSNYIALSLLAALGACTPAHDRASGTPAAQAPPVPAHATPATPSPPSSEETPEPLAHFARMVGGAWKQTAQSGTSMYDTWHWGPGRHSLRMTTDGLSAAGEPWRELHAVYWHPGLKQVRALVLSPFDAGVGEGQIAFDGESAAAEFQLYQSRGVRRLRWFWTFDGPDKYLFQLEEAVGPASWTPLVSFDRSRVPAPAQPPPTAGEPPRLPDKLRALEPLLGAARHATIALGGDARIETTIQWVPYCDGIYARVAAIGKNSRPTHLLDAYLYHHTGAGTLRCLALSSRGGVYEGDVAVLDGGALQLDLRGYEGDQVLRYAVRFDSGNDGALRQRIWSVTGDERTLILDARHERAAPEKD